MNVKFLNLRYVLAFLMLCVTLLGPSSQALAQQTGERKISGQVNDEIGEPIIGAAVKVVGKALGTVTDLDGKFSLEVAPGQLLEISYIGYRTIEVKVGNQSRIQVALAEDTKILDEVIVTGYGAVSKKNLTTSIVKVKADDVPKAANSNMSQMLMGRAAGLQATVASAQPGGGVNIAIRGAGAPIYVVDGVVMPGSSLEGQSGSATTVMPTNVNRSGLAGLNPEDIESIEVLKDASASIYGIGAANGVVLVTTKKGKEGKMKITYDGNMSMVKNYQYLDVLDAQEYMGYVNIFAKEQYMCMQGMGIYGTKPYDNKFEDVFKDTQIRDAQTTNWRDMVLKSGGISNHNVTVQGGGKMLSYYLSGNYFRQEGTVSNSNMERFTLRSNVVAQLTDFLKLTSSINVNRNDNSNGTVGGSTNGRGAEASGALSAALAYPTHLPLYDENGKYTVFSNLPNPVGMEGIGDRSKSDGVNLNFVVDADIIKNMLSAKLVYGYNKESAERNVYIPTTVYYDKMYKSRGSIAKDARENTTLEGILNFNKSFGEVFRFDAVVGMGRYKNQYTGLNVAYTDINDLIGNDNIGAATGTFTPGSYKRADEKRSQFARVNMDFFDRYVVAATVRRDGTDKFFEDKKYAWFPSVSVAWKIFNEKFMEDIKWVNLLKLRASYGVTGNDNLGTSLYGSYAPFGHHVFFDSSASKYVPFYLNSKDYPGVTWEKTVMKNIGLDFSVLQDRVSGSFDYFWNDITNMLGTTNSNGLSMFDTYPVNGGHIRRTGWDATIETKNILTRDFSWTSTITLSHYNSVWKERMPNFDYKEYQRRDDEPVNALYFYRTDGIVNAEMSNVPDHQPENSRIPGAPIIKDLDGNGTIDTKDVDMVDVVPAIYWGFGNTFRYKNWDLDVFIYSQMGLKKYNYAYSWADGTALANQKSNQSQLIHNVWNSETNPNGTIPGIAYQLSNVSLPGGASTDIGYEDASFVRVRNMTLGYNFNANNLGVLSKYISNARIFVDVQNPFTFTSFTGFDPEVYTGGDYKSSKAEYPQTRTYSVGVKVSF